MELITHGSVRTASLVWRATAHAWLYVVVAKVTFRLAPVTCELAEEQDEPNASDNHWNDDPNRGVSTPSDLAPFKRTPEVMLAGYACAPNGPVTSLRTRLIVGAVDKQIEVWTDRVLAQDGSVRVGAPFARMPLRWERAAGGPETTNPVGIPVGDARTPDVYGNAPLPNLQPPDIVVDGPNASIPPIGFGPIAEQWPMRQARLSPQSIAWLERRYADMLPDDFDGDFFQASPADQRLGELRPNERIVLENLLRQHPRLVTSLPGHAPVAFVDAAGGAPFELRLVADTLWIDTDRGVCTVTWRGTLPLRDPAQSGRIVVGLSEPGTRLTWADLHRHRDPRTVQPSPVNEVAASRVKRPTLPFAMPPGTPDVPSRPPPGRRDDMTQTLTDEDDEFSGARTVLPFNKRARGDGDPRAGLPTPLPAAGRPAQSAPPPAIAHPPAIAPPPMALPTSANVDPAASPWAASASPGRPAPVISDAGRNVAYQPAPAPVLASSPAPALNLDKANDAQRGGWGAPTGRSASEPSLEFRRDAGDAAQRGAVAASNAAADAARAPVNEAASPPARHAAVPEGERLAVGFDLFWYDAPKLPRMRAALAPRGSARFERDWSVPETSDRDEAVGRERGEVLRLLSRTPITDVSRVGSVLSRGFDSDGGFEPPLVVLSGELRVPFEKHEWLASIAAIAAAFGSTDKKLKDALALATELAPAGAKAPPDLLDAAVARIREAFDGVYRGMSGPYLDARAERSLLVERRFQAREVFGQPCIRGELGGDARGAGPELPFYMPEALRQRWPLFSRLSIRAIVELRHREDEGESHVHAALALAVAREIRRS